MNPDVKFLIERAMAGSDQLCPAARLRLLRGVAKICPAGSQERESVTQIAFHLQRAESEQLSFRELLSK